MPHVFPIVSPTRLQRLARCKSSGVRITSCRHRLRPWGVSKFALRPPAGPCFQAIAAMLDALLTGPTRPPNGVRKDLRLKLQSLDLQPPAKHISCRSKAAFSTLSTRPSSVQARRMLTTNRLSKSSSYSPSRVSCRAALCCPSFHPKRQIIANHLVPFEVYTRPRHYDVCVFASQGTGNGSGRLEPACLDWEIHERRHCLYCVCQRKALLAPRRARSARKRRCFWPGDWIYSQTDARANRVQGTRSLTNNPIKATLNSISPRQPQSIGRFTA